MSIDNEEEDPGASTGTDDIVDSSTTENAAPEVESNADDKVGHDDADKGSSSADPGETSKPERSAKKNREDLIAQLTGKGEENEEVAEEASESEEEKPETEALAKDDEKPEAEKDPEKPEKDLEAPLDKTATLKTQKRFQELIESRRKVVAEVSKLKPIADYGQGILDFCREAKLTPEVFGGWLALGVEVHKDPSNLPARLMAEAERLAIARGQPLAKKVETVATAPEGLEDLILECALNTELAPEAAKKMLAIVRGASKAKPKEEPAPARQVEQTPRARTEAPPAPAAIQYQREVQNAAAEIDVKDAAYLKQYPADWPKIRDTVTKAMTQYQGTSPTKWAAFFDREVKEALSRVTKPTKAFSSSLRPTQTTSSVSGKAKTGRQEALDLLTGRSKI